MPDQPNPETPKRKRYSPKPETLALLKVSGNPINGLGETTPRRPSPFFWHPPDQHPYGELQIVARQSSRKCPGAAPAFLAAYNYPELIPVAATRNESPAEQLAAEAKAFALSHEADAIGIAPMDPLYVFEGYTIDEPWVIVLALAHNYERLKQIASEKRMRLVTIPMPGPVYFEEQRLPASYANFYVSNAAVLVPTFNDARDRIALGVLSEAFLDRPVVGIHAVDLVWGLGTLHCLTQQQPAMR